MGDIKDIKPLIAVEDDSLFLLILTVAIGLVLAYFLFKKMYNIFKYRCKIDCEKYYYIQFSKIDWSNPKKAAYEATKYGQLLARDKRRKELFLQMRVELDKYKYKQDIKEVDKKTLNYYNLYKQVCDESL